ncbi:MAG: NAD(P)H-quinone oxidoreductase [Planctomycetota bacterium]
MRAIVITRPGGPEVLEVRDGLPSPEPGHEQVRVRVRATALNRADVLQRMGHYPPPPGVPRDIPGLEFAGEVDATGPGVSRWKSGDRVFGLVGGGSYAEQLVVHERTVARIPDGLDWVAAAAVPEAFITAHDALFRLGGLRPGGRVLVHAVGSGVGIAAVQLAASIHATSFGTSRTPSKLARAQELGLSHTLPVDGFEKAVGAQGVDVVIDFVGAPYLARNLEALAPCGRLVVVGLLGGRKESIDLGLVLTKRLSVIGTALRTRPLEEKILVTRTFEQEVVPLLAQGVLKPVVDRVFSLEQVREAHEVMEKNEVFGKIVLKVD